MTPLNEAAATGVETEGIVARPAEKAADIGESVGENARDAADVEAADDERSSGPVAKKPVLTSAAVQTAVK